MRCAKYANAFFCEQWCTYSFPRFAHTSVGGSINNALCISEHLGGTRLLISNNDETIKVYSLPGLQRLTSIQLPTAVNYGKTAIELCLFTLFECISGVSHEKKTPENNHKSDIPASPFFLQSSTVASVSPDGRKMVAVGDSNQVFLYDISVAGGYQKIGTYTGTTTWIPSPDV